MEECDDAMWFVPTARLGRARTQRSDLSTLQHQDRRLDATYRRDFVSHTISGFVPSEDMPIFEIWVVTCEESRSVL